MAADKSLSRDKSGETFSLNLTPELAEVYRDEAARCYGGDLSAALSAAVEQWALSALRAHGVAAIDPVGADPRGAGPAGVPAPPAGVLGGPAGAVDRPVGAVDRPASGPGSAAAEAEFDLTDPHWD